MESAYVALICLQQRVPFIVIRAVSDLAGDGGADSNEVDTFLTLASKNSVTAVLEFFSGLNTREPSPESLTLNYLLRINENELEIDWSKIRHESLAFALYRVVNRNVRERKVVFGYRERVGVGDGIWFDVYLRKEKVLKGVFRKEKRQDWKLECKCVLEGESVARRSRRLRSAWPWWVWVWVWVGV
ncbi:hypothetical protein TB1_016155 [Malus domestica]